MLIVEVKGNTRKDSINQTGDMTLVRWLSGLEYCPKHQKIMGLIPGQDTCPGWWVQSPVGAGAGGNRLMFPSFSLSFLLLLSSLFPYLFL